MIKRVCYICQEEISLFGKVDHVGSFLKGLFFKMNRVHELCYNCSVKYQNKEPTKYTQLAKKMLDL